MGAPRRRQLHRRAPIQPFSAKIETLLHSGITAGCGATAYCPCDTVAALTDGDLPRPGHRGQRRSRAGGRNASADRILLRPRRRVALFRRRAHGLFCKHVHYIAGQNVTLGCAASSTVRRAASGASEMAAFLARCDRGCREAAPRSPSPTGPTRSTGFSYSCDRGRARHPFRRRAGLQHLLQERPLPVGQRRHRRLRANVYCPSQPVTPGPDGEVSLQRLRPRSSTGRRRAAAGTFVGACGPRESLDRLSARIDHAAPGRAAQGTGRAARPRAAVREVGAAVSRAVACEPRTVDLARRNCLGRAARRRDRQEVVRPPGTETPCASTLRARRRAGRPRASSARAARGSGGG